MNNKLKPCPFCGGNAGRAARFNMGYSGDGVKCGKCKAETPSYLVEQKAIDWWNSRADGWISVDIDPCGDDCVPVDLWLSTGERLADCMYLSGLGIYMHHTGKISNATHWMQLPNPPKAASCGE